MELIEHLYHHVRNSLLWLTVYFFLQFGILIALAVLIWLYPQALFLLAVIFFCLLGAVSLYFAIIVLRYVLKVKKLHDLIK